MAKLKSVTGSGSMSCYLDVIGVRIWKFQGKWQLSIGHSRASYSTNAEYATKREAEKAMRKVRREFAKRAIPKMDVELHEQTNEYKLSCIFKQCVEDILAR